MTKKRQHNAPKDDTSPQGDDTPIEDTYVESASEVMDDLVVVTDVAPAITPEVVLEPVAPGVPAVKILPTIF